MVPTSVSGQRIQTDVGLIPEAPSDPARPQGLTSGLLPALARYQQFLKWPIYSLLFINFIFYITEDAATLAREGYQSLWDITGAFATSLDIAGWFGLLLVFEIETYWQQVYAMPKARWTLNALRWVCFGILAHTLVVYTGDLTAALNPEEIALTQTDCTGEGATRYQLHNQVYTPMSAADCLGKITEGTSLWSFEADTLVDKESLKIARVQATASFVECAAWLAAGLAFAAMAWLKRRNVRAGAVTTLARQIPHISYLLIVSCALLWGSYGHYLYTYDSLLWLGGFAMIEANLSTWQTRLTELMGRGKRGVNGGV